MAFRTTYSRIENSEESRAVSTNEAIVTINGLKVGRCQGLRTSLQANSRPIQEMGSDRNVEFVPGIKRFQGTLQSITIQYGNLVQRLASMAGGSIDPDSIAAIISNMPEFDISIVQRGAPSFTAPQLYSPPGGFQDLAGAGQVIKTLIGCVISSAEQPFNVNEPLIMESVSFEYIDEVVSPQSVRRQQSAGSVIGGAFNV